MKLPFSLPRALVPMPKDDRFYALLRQGTELVLEASEAFVGLLEHYDERETRVANLKDIEERGDRVIHDIMRNLHRTFVTPIDREDIARLAENLDDVVDAIEEAAKLLDEYEIPEPTERMKELGVTILESARELMAAIDKLRFRGAKLQEVLPHCIEINRLENVADDVSARAIGELFREADSAIDVIKYRDIYGMLEHTADLCEDAANVLEGIVLKNA